MEDLTKKPGVDLVLPKGIALHELAEKLTRLHATRSRVSP